VAIEKSGELWCPKCNRWITQEEIESTIREENLKSLAQLLPKIPPPKQRRS